MELKKKFNIQIRFSSKSIQQVNLPYADCKSLIAFSAALVWGADRAFDDLFRKYNIQQD